MLRGVHAFVVEAEATPPAPAKALALATQMARNLQAMGTATRTLEAALREASPSGRAGRIARLQQQVAELHAANRDLEGEKKSLIASVQQMLAGSSKREELSGAVQQAQQQAAALQQQLEGAKASAGATAQRLEASNALLAQRLRACQAAPKPTASPLVQSTLACERKLSEATARAATAMVRQATMRDTVHQLMRSKAKGPPANETKHEPAVVTNIAAHMGDTAKIDAYIVTSGDVPFEVAELDPAAAPTIALRLAPSAAPKVAPEPTLPVWPMELAKLAAAQDAAPAAPAAPSAPNATSAPAPKEVVASALKQLAAQAVAKRAPSPDAPSSDAPSPVVRRVPQEAADEIGRYLRGETAPANTVAPPAPAPEEVVSPTRSRLLLAQQKLAALA